MRLPKREAWVMMLYGIVYLPVWIGVVVWRWMKNLYERITQ